MTKNYITKHIKTKYVNEEVILRFTSYTDGTPALQMLTQRGGPVATATVNLSAYGYNPKPGHIIVKDYAEGEGMVDALLEAGIITSRGKAYSFGFVNEGAFECEVSADYTELLTKN